MMQWAADGGPLELLELLPVFLVVAAAAGTALWVIRR